MTTQPDNDDLWRFGVAVIRTPFALLQILWFPIGVILAVGLYGGGVILVTCARIAFFPAVVLFGLMANDKKLVTEYGDKTGQIFNGLNDFRRDIPKWWANIFKWWGGRR